MRWIVPVLLPALVVAGTAAAQPLCDSHESVVDALAKGYSERLSAVGIAGGAGVLEIFSSPEGKTWTILVTDTDGQACVLAVGTGWEVVGTEDSPNVAGNPTSGSGKGGGI